MLPVIALYFLGGTIFALSVGFRLYFKQVENRYLFIQNTQQLETDIPPRYDSEEALTEPPPKYEN